MAYSKFTNAELKEKFGIRIGYQLDIFSKVKSRQPSKLLLAILEQNLNLALLQGTEKARSELIIAPIFVELRNQAKEKISFFSGIEFNVDKKLGLWGRADFLVSRSDYQTVLESPVIVAVEAKEQDFDGGITQCVAEMQAAKIFNERHGNPTDVIYGCVTTGDVWRFLVMKNEDVLTETSSFDVHENLDRILGILYAMSLGEID